jgi:hypothetical protein
VIVLRTLGAPQRRLVGGRRPRAAATAEPEPVPTSRATIIHPGPLASSADADAWLEMGETERTSEVDGATRALNLVLRAHRAAAGDPYARDVRAEMAIAVRLGYGQGEQVADGRFERAIELPKLPPKRKRGELLAPQERLAAILGGRDRLLAGEELLLRARLDLDAGRGREAALQARIALEALLAELDEKFSQPLRGLRDPLARASNYALEGDLDAADAAAVEDAVALMETAVRRRGFTDLSQKPLQSPPSS